jgi:hypothetical protein
MKQRYYWVRFSVIFFILILSLGCNKEKAEAIKIAAEKFRVEAVAAIEKVNHLLIQSITVLVDEEDALKRIAGDLAEEEKIEAKELAFLLKEGDISEDAAKKVKQEFEMIAQGYYQFEEMFRSLPKGAFLARGAVKKSEKFAIRLTIQLIQFAEHLKHHPVQYTERRALLLKKISEAKKIGDPNARLDRLMGIAKDIVDLQKDEQKANQEAIVQCLRAAETGKIIAHLIRDYGSLSVEDLLMAVRNTLSFVAGISGGHQDVVGLLERYKAVETTIREDPYWKEILAEKIIQ